MHCTIHNPVTEQWFSFCTLQKEDIQLKPIMFYILGKKKKTTTDLYSSLQCVGGGFCLFFFLVDVSVLLCFLWFPNTVQKHLSKMQQCFLAEMYVVSSIILEYQKQSSLQKPEHPYSNVCTSDIQQLALMFAALIKFYGLLDSTETQTCLRTGEYFNFFIPVIFLI